VANSIYRLLISLFISVSSQAIAKSASETAREYYNLLQQGDYRAAVRYLDPAGLAEFRSLMSFDKEISVEQKQIYFREFFEPDLNDESYEKLSDTDFSAAFLNGVLTSEGLAQMINFKSSEIIGELIEHEDLAYVVTRQWVSLGGHKMEFVDVTSFNKTGGEWKVRMTGKIKSVAVMIRQQFLDRHNAKL